MIPRLMDTQGTLGSGGAAAGRPAAGPGLDPEVRGRDARGLLVITATSGKGGVGKTNLIANLAVAMAEMGRRVMLLDGDLSLANVDLLMGLVPQYNLYDVVMGRRRIDEIALTGPADIRIIPAASGVEEMANLDDYRREVMVRSLQTMTRDRDVLLVDTGSGIHRQNLRLAQMGEEILVVTTPEPTAFSDAYATIKILAGRRLARPPRLVVNMATSQAEALRVAGRVARVARQFLGFEPQLYGVVPMDDSVPRAVKAQQVFVKSAAEAPASLGVRDLARRLLEPSASPLQMDTPAKAQPPLAKAA